MQIVSQVSGTKFLFNHHTIFSVIKCGNGNNMENIPELIGGLVRCEKYPDISCWWIQLIQLRSSQPKVPKEPRPMVSLRSGHLAKPW